MTDDSAAIAATNSTPPDASALPSGTPVETPAGHEQKPAAAVPSVSAPADDFDENLIPEGSRENFKKYRETTRQKLENASREKYQIEAQLKQLQAQNQRPADLKELGEMPKLEDPQYKNIEDYTKAITDWAKKAGVAEFTQRQTQEDAQRRQLSENAKLYAKGQMAMQKYNDYRQVVEPLIQVADQLPVLKQYVSESDNGTDVLYQLCKNPTLLDSLMKMSPFQQGRELIRLEGLSSAPQTKRETKAPAPMNPVGGGDGNVTKLVDLTKKDDVTDYIARRNREDLRKKKGLN